MVAILFRQREQPSLPFVVLFFRKRELIFSNQRLPADFQACVPFAFFLDIYNDLPCFPLSRSFLLSKKLPVNVSERCA